MKDYKCKNGYTWNQDSLGRLVNEKTSSSVAVRRDDFILSHGSWNIAVTHDVVAEVLRRNGYICERKKDVRMGYAISEDEPDSLKIGIVAHAGGCLDTRTIAQDEVDVLGWLESSKHQRLPRSRCECTAIDKDLADEMDDFPHTVVPDGARYCSHRLDVLRRQYVVTYSFPPDDAIKHGLAALDARVEQALDTLSHDDGPPMMSEHADAAIKSGGLEDFQSSAAHWLPITTDPADAPDDCITYEEMVKDAMAEGNFALANLYFARAVEDGELWVRDMIAPNCAARPAFIRALELGVVADSDQWDRLQAACKSLAERLDTSAGPQKCTAHGCTNGTAMPFTPGIAPYPCSTCKGTGYVG